jgi:DNA polymerase/3'-5' exonuclease PolX
MAKVKNHNLAEHVRLHAKTRTNTYARKSLEKSADIIEKLDYSIAIIDDLKTLWGKQGIGPSSLACMKDWFNSGCPAYSKPWESLIGIPGITDETAQKLYRYGIHTQDILARYKEGDIVEGIKISKQTEICARHMTCGRFSREEAKTILGLFPAGIPCGSYRRCKETVGDIDIVVTNREEYLQNVNILDFIIVSGEQKTSGLKVCRQVDIRIGDWATILYLTGSKEHNIKMRSIAKSKSLTLNEYGLFLSNGTRLDSGKTEEEIFALLDIEYVQPILR